jgi:trans-2,3-dihydro-3-hydroxyanthranilate isomerase
VRIFTPKAEIPFAGHPTIGTALVLATLGRVSRKGPKGRLVMEQLAGTVPVEISYEDDRPVEAELTAPERPWHKAGPPEADCAALVGLSPAQVRAACIASAGTPFLIVEVTDLAALAQAVSPPASAAGLLAGPAANGVLLFVRTAGDREHDIRVRMFAPLHGIVEDPATGSAAAALAGLLGDVDGTCDGWRGWRIGQGIEMRRPSLIVARALREGGRVAEVRVAGSAVLVAEGSIETDRQEERGGAQDAAA